MLARQISKYQCTIESMVINKVRKKLSKNIYEIHKCLVVIKSNISLYAQESRAV